MTLLIGKPCFAHTIYTRQREKRKAENMDWISGILDFALHLFPKHLCGFGEQLQWRALHLFLRLVFRGRMSFSGGN